MVPLPTAPPVPCPRPTWLSGLTQADWGPCVQGGARGGAFGQRRGAVSIVVWMRRTWRTRRTCQKCTVHGNGTTIKTHAACIIKPRPLLRFDPGPDPACPFLDLCFARPGHAQGRAEPPLLRAPRQGELGGQGSPPRRATGGRRAGGGQPPHAAPHRVARGRTRCGLAWLARLFRVRVVRGGAGRRRGGPLARRKPRVRVAPAGAAAAAAEEYH